MDVLTWKVVLGGDSIGQWPKVHSCNRCFTQSLSQNPGGIGVGLVASVPEELSHCYRLCWVPQQLWQRLESVPAEANMLTASTFQWKLATGMMWQMHLGLQNGSSASSVHAIWLILFLFLCYFACSLCSKADIWSHHRNLLSRMMPVCKRVSGAEDDQFLCFDAVQSVRETCLGTLGIAKCTSRLKCCWMDAKMIPQVDRKTRSSILYSFLVTLANFGKMAVWLRDQHGANGMWW